MVSMRRSGFGTSLSAVVFLASIPLSLVVFLVALSAPAVAQVWTQYGPAARFSHTAVFDPTTGKMIVFAGQNSATNTNLNDLWLETTSTQKNLTSSRLLPSGTLPSGRFGHVATYDPNSNRMTIFGGGTGLPAPCLNDVWILANANGEGGTPTWISATPRGASPAARMRHTGVYDPTTNSMIVFGGNNCSTGYFNDVWVMSNANGESGRHLWTQLQPSGTPPAARESASAIYDSVNNIMVVYGGDAGGANFGDVWLLLNANGSSGTPTWEQVTPSGTTPLSRSGHTATYDSANNRMTIFGGFHNTVALSDSWVLTFANGIGGTPAWTQITTTGTAPALGFHTAVYDPSSNDMYVFAGSSSAAKLAGDDHAFTLSSANGIGSSLWSRGGPPARYSQAMFYDSVTDSVFIQDGQHAVTNTNIDDYWQTANVSTTTNLNWVPINVGGQHPKARWGHAAQYDSASNRLMVFGGATGFPAPCMNDYWVMKNANNSHAKPIWNSISATGTLPAVRTRYVSAYDPTTNTLIVFGGYNCQSTFYNDVWILKNANDVTGTPAWTQLSPTGSIPGVRESSSAVYNSATNTLTIYGGDAGAAPFGDIWVLSHANGTGGTPSWSEITPAGNGPAARSGHTAIYNQQNNVMTVYGGYDGANLLSDTWILENANGQGGAAAWTEIVPQTTAPARRFASAVYDPAVNQMNTFGGEFSIPVLPDDHLFSLTDATGQP